MKPLYSSLLHMQENWLRRQLFCFAVIFRVSDFFFFVVPYQCLECERLFQAPAVFLAKRFHCSSFSTAQGEEFHLAFSSPGHCPNHQDVNYMTLLQENFLKTWCLDKNISVLKSHFVENVLTSSGMLLSLLNKLQQQPWDVHTAPSKEKSHSSKIPVCLGAALFFW